VASKPEEIGPTGSITVPVAFTVPPVPGPFQQRLVILQEAAPPLALTIDGVSVIGNGLQCFPSVVNFGTTEGKTRSKRTLYVQRFDHSPVRLKAVRSSDPALRPSVANTVQGATRVEIALELAAASAFEGNSVFRATLLVEAEGEKPDEMDKLEVPVVGSRDRDGSPFQKSIFVDRLEVGSAAIYPLMLAGAKSTKIDTITFAGDHRDVLLTCGGRLDHHDGRRGNNHQIHGAGQISRARSKLGLPTGHQSLASPETRRSRWLSFSANMI
jgi:hypothetical protein